MTVQNIKNPTGMHVSSETVVKHFQIHEELHICFYSPLYFETYVCRPVVFDIVNLTLFLLSKSVALF